MKKILRGDADAIETQTESESTNVDGVPAATEKRRHFYVKNPLNGKWLELENAEAQASVTIDGESVPIFFDELAILNPSSQSVVTGEGHEAITRQIVSDLFPDLLPDYLISHGGRAWVEIGRRFRVWTGMMLPARHRDWRALADWAELSPPEEITEKWLDEFLVPRIRVLWLKCQQSGIRVEHSPNEEKSTSHEEEPVLTAPTIHPGTADPPDLFHKYGTPIGPLCGSRTALGFSLHEDDHLRNVSRITSRFGVDCV